MLKYSLRRLWEVIPTTIGIILLAFALFNVIGGSPAETVLGKNASAESIAAFNRQFGYDKPLIFGEIGPGFFDSQFFHFLADFARGDFGYSQEMQESVASVLKRGVGPSLSLTVPILLGGTVIALMLGMLAAAFRGRGVDRSILLFSTVLMSVNYVVWVLAGQYLLSFKLGLFPVWGFGNWFYLVLPCAIGVLSSLGADVRFYRTAFLDELYRPYVLAVRSKGISWAQVFVRHILPNALIPVVTYVSLSIPWLFTGSLLLESFFGIPGLGSVSINAIHSADMAVVRAVVVLGAVSYQLVNLLTDLTYAWVDPRVRYA